MKRQRLRAVVVLLALVGTTLVGTGQASAGSFSRVTPVPANGKVSCFGYYGTFKVGTEVVVIDWDTSSDECFGIATDRTIWHTWPGSGGWTPMPGGAHADDISGIDEDAGGIREVYIYVKSNSSTWFQVYYPSWGWTGDWSRWP